MSSAIHQPLPSAKHHDPFGFARATPLARSIWKLAGTFLWVRITDKFLPSCFISNLVIILGILLVLFYHAYTQYSDHRRRHRALPRHFGKIACIGEEGSGNNRVFVLDSGSYYHATGDRNFLDPATLALSRLGTISVGDGSVMEVSGHGSINRDNLTLACVLYVPGLEVNVVSVRMLTELDYLVQFIGDEFFVREICTEAMIGRGRLGRGMYQVNSLKVPLDRERCFDCALLGRLYDRS